MADGLQEPDAEAAQKDAGGRSYRRSLLLFLAVTNVLLLVALSAAAAGCGALLATRSGPQTPLPTVDASKTGQGAANTGDKIPQFVFLTAQNSMVRNATMVWTQRSVRSDIDFEPVHNYLVLRRQGNYYLSVNLHLSCTKMPCRAGRVTLHVKGPKGSVLTCHVDLGNDEKEKKESCWAEVPMETGVRLLAEMTVTEVLENWKLEMMNSNLLMFLLDQPGT